MAARGRSETPSYLVVGRILGAWGARGELKVAATTEFSQRFSPEGRLYVQEQPFIIEESRPQGKFWVLKLASVDDVVAAKAMMGRYLEVPWEEALSLPPGQYYRFQIVGLQVFSSGGEPLGEVVEVISNPANDVYLVRGLRGEFLVPAIEDVVKEIDLEAGRMVIEVLPGLL